MRSPRIVAAWRLRAAALTCVVASFILLVVFERPQGHAAIHARDPRWSTDGAGTPALQTEWARAVPAALEYAQRLHADQPQHSAPAPHASAPATHEANGVRPPAQMAVSAPTADKRDPLLTASPVPALAQTATSLTAAIRHDSLASDDAAPAAGTVASALTAPPPELTDAGAVKVLDSEQRADAAQQASSERYSTAAPTPPPHRVDDSSLAPGPPQAQRSTDTAGCEAAAGALNNFTEIVAADRKRAGVAFDLGAFAHCSVQSSPRTAAARPVVEPEPIAEHSGSEGEPADASGGGAGIVAVNQQAHTSVDSAVRSDDDALQPPGQASQSVADAALHTAPGEGAPPLTQSSKLDKAHSRDSDRNEQPASACEDAFSDWNTPGVPPFQGTLLDAENCTWTVPLQFSHNTKFVGDIREVQTLPDPRCGPPDLQLRGTDTCKSASKLRPSPPPARTATVLDAWWHSAPADPCLDGVYTSACQLQDVLAGDLEAPGELQRVADARSWKGEIVFTAVNAQGVRLAVNWALSLREQGIEHAFVVTDSAALCKALFYSEARVSCGWTSFLFGHPGLAKWDIETCSAEQPDCRPPVHLWYARLHYMARFVDLGLNPMYMDTDLTAQANFYRFFKTPGHPLARHNAFLQREGGCLTCSNIGFLYCQNCTVGGPAQQIFQGAVDRALAALDLGEPLQMFRPLVEAGVIVEEDVTEIFKGGKNALWDQHIVNDVVESAVAGTDVRRRQWAAWLSARGRHAYAQQVLNVTGQPDALPGWEMDWQGAAWADLVWPPEAHAVAPHESIGMPPAWLVGGYSGEHDHLKWGGALGFWGRAAPAIAHFVGSPEKRATMQSLGWWHYDADVAATVVQRALRAQEWEAPHVLRLEGAEAEAEAASWAAAAPALATIRAEVSARRFIAYSGPPHAAADITTFAAGYFSGLWNLVALGALTGRIAVLPLVQCSSPWISRQAESRLGIDQGNWRPTWGPDERPLNGLNLFPCTRDAGLPSAEPEEHCCAPWVGGTAPMSPTVVDGVGFVHRLDFEHAVRAAASDGSWREGRQGVQVGLGEHRPESQTRRLHASSAATAEDSAMDPARSGDSEVARALAPLHSAPVSVGVERGQQPPTGSTTVGALLLAPAPSLLDALQASLDAQLADVPAGSARATDAQAGPASVHAVYESSASVAELQAWLHSYEQPQVLYVRAARLEDLPSLRPEHLPDDVVHRLRGVLDSAVFGRWREEHLAPLGW